MLTAVREQDAYTNLVLPPMLRSRGVAGRDAAFATELVSGTIRRQGTYDAVIAANVDRPLAKVDPDVLDALRLGTHQLLAMRVPSHAAVGTTVDLVRSRVGRGPTGFVNAVLRKVAAHDLDGWVRRVAPDPVADPVGFAAVAHSHPQWVVEELQRALGDDGELEALLAADNAAPKVTLVARPGLASVEELVGAGGTASSMSPYAVELSGETPGPSPLSRRGGPGCRTRGPSWSRSPCRARRSTAATSGGSTCVPAPAASPRCWRPSPLSAVPGSSRRSGSTTARCWSAARRPPHVRGCSAW